MNEVPDWLRIRVERVNAGLQQWHDRVSADAPLALRNAMAYSLFAPGKRLRPVLVGLAAEAAGGSFEQALAAGCALEMVHTYSLIHDDLPAMDDDDLRRGLPTCHRQFGEALAILAGDALLTAAFEVIALGYPPRTAAVATLELARGAGSVGMIAGQVLDLGAEGKVPDTGPPASLRDLEALHERKTGALFLTAIRLGLWAAQGERPAGPDQRLLDVLERYARAFGLAFQIADDLLDVEGSRERAGKEVGKDAGRGKLTFPQMLGLLESRRRAADLYHQAIAAATELGPKGALLRDLAEWVARRDA